MAEGEKTQPPSAKRRREAAAEGNVWQPRELAPAAAVLTAALAGAVGGPVLWRAMAAYLADALAGGAEGPSLALVPWRLPAALAVLVLVVTAGLSIAASRHVALSALAPKFSRINPANGLGRLFSLAGLAGAGTALLKVAAVAGVALVVVRPLLPALAYIGDDGGALLLVGDAVLRLVAASALLLAVIAIVDGGISFVLRERKLMMTLDEVRREQRQDNGAPEVKAALKRAQYAAATRRLRSGMAEAAVVVVNPVHFAVALRYRPGVDQVPVVLEKGRLEMAQAVIAVARELGIPVIRTPRLARALFFTAARGEAVREELFSAVATILAFVMSFDAPQETPAPAVFVPPDFDFDESGGRRKPGAPLPL